MEVLSELVHFLIREVLSEIVHAVHAVELVAVRNGTVI